MRVKEVATRSASASMREFFSRVVRGHAPSERVARREMSYAEERGWVREGDH